MANLRSYPGFFFGCMVLARHRDLQAGYPGDARAVDVEEKLQRWLGSLLLARERGAALGPLFGTVLRTKNWSWVFYGSATAMAMN